MPEQVGVCDGANSSPALYHELMTTTDFVVLILRWLHIAAAIVAIGGAFFTRFALMPAASSTLDDAAHVKLREALRARWFKIVNACIAVLLVTGGINFVLVALPPKIEPMPYHAIFGVKFLAALGVFFIASALVGTGQGLAAMRAHRARWLTILLILAAGIVLLSGVLNRIRINQSSRLRAPATARLDHPDSPITT
jgi:hypothetical protein